MPADLKLTTRARSPYWYIRGTDNEGNQVFQSTGTADKGVAEDFLTRAKARLLDERMFGKKAVVTFHEAARAYMKDGGQSTYLSRELANGARAGLMHYFSESLLLKDITQEMLDQAARDICKPGAGRETLIRNAYTPFIAVWRFAAKRDWAEPKLWERPRKPKGTAVSAPAVTRSGTTWVPYERAWQFVSKMSPGPAMLMTAFFYSGMRPIESFALDCMQVDVPGRWIVLLGSKTGEARGVPMHEMLVPMFTGLVPDGGRVFKTPRGGDYPITDDVTKGQVNSAIKGARKRSGIKDISPYNGRHTVSTQLVIEGVHPHIKDQILGHAVDDMSRHYTHVPQAPLIEAINKLPVIDAWRDAPWMRDPLKFRPKLYSPITGDKGGDIIRLREDGRTLREIQEETGVSQASVFAVLREAGLTGTNAAKGLKRERKVDELPRKRA